MTGRRCSAAQVLGALSLDSGVRRREVSSVFVRLNIAGFLFSARLFGSIDAKVGWIQELDAIFGNIMPNRFGK